MITCQYTRVEPESLLGPASHTDLSNQMPNERSVILRLVRKRDK